MPQTSGMLCVMVVVWRAVFARSEETILDRFASETEIDDRRSHDAGRALIDARFE